MLDSIRSAEPNLAVWRRAHVAGELHGVRDARARLWLLPTEPRPEEVSVDIRDAPPPKLLSGEIRIRDAEKFMEERSSWQSA